MEPVNEQILEILDAQAEHYQDLLGILDRQARCLRQDDLVGVGTATAEVRRVMERAGKLGLRLSPLVAGWGKGDETDRRVTGAAEAIRGLIGQLQELRVRNEALARSAMLRKRREMLSLSAGANAVRGYSPRPTAQARFVDRKK